MGEPGRWQRKMRDSLLKSLEADATDALSRDCLEEVVSAPSLRPMVCGPIPRKAVFDIYSRRGRHCEERKVGVEGFPRLVRLLADESVSEVKLYDLSVHRRYLVFVDSRSERILGVLRFPVDRKDPNPRAG